MYAKKYVLALLSNQGNSFSLKQLKSFRDSRGSLVTQITYEPFWYTSAALLLSVAEFSASVPCLKSITWVMTWSSRNILSSFEQKLENKPHSIQTPLFEIACPISFQTDFRTTVRFVLWLVMWTREGETSTTTIIKSLFDLVLCLGENFKRRFQSMIVAQSSVEVMREKIVQSSTAKFNVSSSQTTC